MFGNANTSSDEIAMDYEVADALLFFFSLSLILITQDSGGARLFP